MALAALTNIIAFVLYLVSNGSTKVSQLLERKAPAYSRSTRFDLISDSDST